MICDNHSQKIEFIDFKASFSKKYFKCKSCLTENKLDSSKLISFEEFINCEEDQYVKNWPINIPLDTYDEICNQIYNNSFISMYDKAHKQLSDLFEKIQKEFVRISTAIEKQKQYLTLNTIKNIYNQVAYKEDIQKYFKDIKQEKEQDGIKPAIYLFYQATSNFKNTQTFQQNIKFLDKILSPYQINNIEKLQTIITSLLQNITIDLPEINGNFDFSNELNKIENNQKKVEKLSSICNNVNQFDLSQLDKTSEQITQLVKQFKNQQIVNPLLFQPLNQNSLFGNPTKNNNL